MRAILSRLLRAWLRRLPRTSPSRPAPGASEIASRSTAADTSPRTSANAGAWMGNLLPPP